MSRSAIVELGAEHTEKGVSTRRLWVDGFEGRRVPCVVLTPEAVEGRRPVVMLGHGAGGHKEEPTMLAIARSFVRREGWAVAIIDGPVHGERRSDSGGNVGLEAREALADRATFEAMAVDWQRTVDACGELANVGNERAAYLGFSMGTVLGILAVAEESRFRCGVLAIGGILAKRPNLLSRAAERIDRPVLLINQTEDDIFSREAAFALYDALPEPKRIFFYPGGHANIPQEAMERIREFLQAHLVGDGMERGARTGAQ